MKDVFKKLYANKAVRAAVVSLVLAVAAAFGYSQTGCSQKQTEAARARVDLFECRVAALKPVVGDVFDAEALVRDLYAGKADLGQALGALRLTPAEGKQVLDALGMCEPDANVPVGSAS